MRNGLEVKVPQLSESVAEATLVNWHKKAGEYVKRDENLIDIETDKVVLETPAPQSGVLAKIIKGDGGTVASNEVIAQIDTEAAKPAAASGSGRARSPNGSQAGCRAERRPDGRAWRCRPRRSSRRRRRSTRRRSPAPGAAGALPKAMCSAGAPRRRRTAETGAPMVRPNTPPVAPQNGADSGAAARAGAAGRSLGSSASGPSSACRCRGCARASPSAWCSRSRPPRSSRRSTK